MIPIAIKFLFIWTSGFGGEH